MLIGRKYGGPPPIARLATCCITIADYRRQELVEYESRYWCMQMALRATVRVRSSLSVR
jgi:hypothetical protein